MPKATVAFYALLLLTHSAVAQEDTATVRFYGRPLFSVGANEAFPARERAAQIERRLDRFVSTTAPPWQVVVAPAPDTTDARVIRAGEALIVTVTARDAEDNLQDLDSVAAAWSAAINNALDRAPRSDPTSWYGFAIRVESAFRSAFGRLLESAARIIPGALAAVIVLALFWLVGSGLRRLLQRVLSKAIDDKTAASLIKQAAYYTIWMIGILVAAGALGFEPATVVTGLGLTSLALGFALKDILSNFVSGMLLLVLRPFDLGDQIVVGETEGSVERIELRATQIRTYDGRVVYVPNADILTSRLINNTASPVRRASITLPLGYDQDLERTLGTLTDAIRSGAGVLAERPAIARVKELSSSEILIELTFWTDSQRSDFAATTSAVRRAVVEACKRDDIALPQPSVRIIKTEPADEQIPQP